MSVCFRLRTLSQILYHSQELAVELLKNQLDAVLHNMLWRLDQMTSVVPSNLVRSVIPKSLED